ncbi:MULTISPECIES: bifunctional 3-(3-hydroxy-phenyl)propionate/3-hydroxycinnamic acid hydroxylase [unclassified Salinibacterium]|uniref:bifunctional 3-(3-hydroxy-phenyl)propionate/3-hydroxycinnamic acid hydroxylase n=1 Tax=unclassified Salinibacterium TaxID=2632331 RepID=UPI001423781C|nr:MULTISPECIES: bifunctional 3-(3-hydroxy-phenyl)propionate/3-hydroxycinnamic acid hydroxylase [unclassified Salinibacterium]
MAAHDTFDCDVAIVGLGPVGAFMANLLDEAGLAVIAIDREPDILPIPRAVGIDGEIMRVVQAVGLTDELEPLLKVFRGTEYRDVDGNVVTTRPGVAGEGTQAWPDRYNVHQPDLEGVLRDGLARRGVTLLLEHEVIDVLQDDEAATVVATDIRAGEERRLRARYVIGCDGGRSIVRRTMGAELEDFGLNQPWIVADFAIDDTADLPGVNVHFADAEAPIIYINVVRNLRRFEFRARPDEDLDRAVEPELLWKRVERWITPDNAELLRAAVYTHRSLVSRTWWSGRLLLAGDAAHQTPPFLGQGLCTGVRDVSTLAWRLQAVIRDGADPSILAGYENERAEHARFYIRTATALGSVLTAPEKSKLTALNQRVGREGSGTPPRLGTGAFIESDELAGTLAPQARLADGTRLDDTVGYRFALAMTEEFAASLDEELIARIDRAGIARVVATGDARLWLDRLRASAAIVRPDRYYYGIFTAVDDVVSAVDQIGALLGTGERETSHAR